MSSALLTDQQAWDRIDSPWLAMDEADAQMDEFARMPAGTVWPTPAPVREPEPAPVCFGWSVEWVGLFAPEDYRDGYLAGLAELRLGADEREFGNEREARAEFERITAALQVGPTPILRRFDTYGRPVYEPLHRRAILRGRTLSSKGTYRIWVTLAAWNERTGCYE